MFNRSSSGMEKFWQENTLVSNDINILCYADDTPILAENVNEFQLLLSQFNGTGNFFILIVSVSKTKLI